MARSRPVSHEEVPTRVAERPHEDEHEWAITGLHHVAFAHDAGNEIENAFERILGLTVGHSEEGPGFVERMIPTPDGCFIQLLEATGDGVVDRFVTQRGDALHHVAFCVTEIDTAVADLRMRGIRLVGDAPRPGGMGTRIAFLHPSDFGGMLVELVETG